MLTVAKVSKKFENYNGNSPLLVLSDVSLHIEKGSFISIMGPSGCGKTTLLRILAGLEKPDSGEVKVGEKTLNAPGEASVLISQKNDLLPWRTVIKNIEFGLELKGMNYQERHKRAMELISSFGLKGFEDYYPYQLSGGMARKVSFLRAIITSPQVIFMDEPFVFLDREVSYEIQEFLQSAWMKSRCTIVLVSHSIDEAIFLSQKILLFSKRPGRIIKEIDNKLPYPRNRYSKEFIDFRTEVEMIMKEGK
ncbi:MAG: ABC transporter ATP-binding protein [Candidatus Schekmanbacteria bacterium]|nr:MAG: ABC transporter ATP-binding protein [Candidatus Schekmanbacteria bacterium]